MALLVGHSAGIDRIRRSCYDPARIRGSPESQMLRRRRPIVPHGPSAFFLAPEPGPAGLPLAPDPIPEDGQDEEARFPGGGHGAVAPSSIPSRMRAGGTAHAAVRR